MENHEENICLCAINRIFGFNPKVAHGLISAFGSSTEIFKLNEKDISQIPGLKPEFKQKLTRRTRDETERELEQLARKDITFCGFSEKGYPPLLRECSDSPIGLYIRSKTPAAELWNSDRHISVVGTRDLSPYGKTWCRRIVEALAMTKETPPIISGLALGTDIHAHANALEYNLPTIAVMATGPEDVYPHRHLQMAERLVHTPGCALITDYPPGTTPLPCNFLRRNRIIAGISDATILIESKIRGGGLMTSRLAFSYDRDVLALPGRIDDIRSQGCNELISKKIAEPIVSMKDLLKNLGLTGLSHFSQERPAEWIGLTKDIVMLIKEESGIGIEDIAIRTGAGYKKTNEIINTLEIDGIITVDLLQRCCINTKNM